MPQRTYALEKDGPKRLEISWKGLWKNLTIRLDGNTVGTIPGQKELSAGQEFHLPDGSTLKVQLVTVKKFSAAELQVLRNGQPLPGSASNPETKIKGAYGVVFFIAGLNIVLGIAVLFQIEFLQQIGIGFYPIIYGLVFLVLGFFVKRNSMVALIIAIAIFALDSILSFVYAASQGSPLLAAFARFFLIIPMIQGIGAIKAIKRSGE